MAEAQGLVGIGPVSEVAALTEAVAAATRRVREGEAVLIDARVEPEYAAAMTEGMTSVD